MQYQISQQGIQPTGNELRVIETRLALYLSRYSNIVSDFEIHFEHISEHQASSTLVQCTLSIKLQNDNKIHITDTGKSLSDAFLISITRLKRTVERNLKRHNATRVGNSFDNRAN